jgi:hypothetical protein
MKTPENAWKATLVIYFFALIVASVYILIYIWNPVEDSLHRLKIQNTTTTGPFKNETITTTVNDTAIKTQVIILTKLKEDNSTIRYENTSVMPITGRWLNTDPESLFVNREVRLLLLTSIFAILGSSAHGIASVTTWIGQNKLERSWAAWYFVRPPIAVAIAIMVYLAFRAGFVTGGASAISDFGVAAIGALVGLLTDEATTKLRDIFDTLFGIRKPDEEKGDVGARGRGAKIILEPNKTEVKVGETLNLNVKVFKSDGSPANKVEVHLSILKSNIAEFVELPAPPRDKIDKETDLKGAAITKINGLTAGETPITATAAVEEAIKGKIQTNSAADIFILKVAA